MAVKIPTYERSVNLDAAAHTIPRMHATDAPGKALGRVGEEMMRAAAHFQKREEQFENFQMAQRETRARDAIHAIVKEEAQNYDPGRDTPGTMHNRVMARVGPVLAGLEASAPDRLRPYYQERSRTYSEQASIGAAQGEHGIAKVYYTKALDQLAGDLKAGLEGNPEGFQTAVQQMTHTVNGAVNIPAVQRRTMVQAYTKALAEGAVKGYIAQGRHDDARTFVGGLKDLEGVDTGISKVPHDGVGAQSGLNQRMINKINANPAVAQAIEQAAKEEGVDPNLAKAVAGIESGGNPNAGTGSYKGLFQLDQRGFDRFGGGDIFSPLDNARAGVRSLKNDIGAFTNATGREPTATEIYLSHQQGQGGVLSHISNPDQPAWQSMYQTAEGRQKGEAWAKRAVWGNVPDDMKERFGSVEKMTSRDFVDLWHEKITGHGAQPERPAANDRPKVSVDPETGKMTMGKPEAPAAPVMVADASGRIIGGMVVATDSVDAITQSTPSSGVIGARESGPAATPAGVITKAPAHRGKWGAMSPWSTWTDTMTATIDAAQSKTQVKDVSMKASLKQYVESDIASIQNTGKPVAFDRETSKYFGIDTLTPELITSKLGPAASVDWLDRRHTAMRVNAATEGMDQLPEDAIYAALDAITPQGGEQNFVRSEKVYQTVAKRAAGILALRRDDPAQAVDQVPQVQAAKQKVMANPTDAQAQKELIDARMKAQEFLGIPETARSPITNNEASALAAPLLDRANANPSAVATQVVKNIMAMTGNNPDISHRALTRVLMVKGIDNDKAATVATALQSAGRPVAQPMPQEREAKPAYDFIAGVEPGVYDPLTGMLPTGRAEKTAPVDRSIFSAGQTFLPPEHIKKLRGDPTLSSGFDETYGMGASDWVFNNSPGGNPGVNFPPPDLFSTPTEMDTSFYAPDDL